MKTYGPRKYLLPLGAALFLALSLSSAFAAGKVTFSQDDGANGKTSGTANNPDSPAWHRKLWTGSFDTASDASGAAAKQLEGLDTSECNEYLSETKAKDKSEKPVDSNLLYSACMQRMQSAGGYAAQARSIQKQQKAMSLISKASDLAAVGAVGATIYGEMGMKQQNQAYTYESAANIQQKAGQVSYVTGAADLTMGAYAYVAQKNKLEAMKNTISGSTGGVKATADPALNGALTNAVEAAKKAAYAHMMWGAGKLAAGYGMMYLAKKSQDQADKMHSLQDLQEQNALLAQRQAAAGAVPTVQQTVVVGSPSVPYYQSNQPTFTIPGSTAASASAQHTGVVNYSVPGGSTGSSAPISSVNARGLASAATSSVKGGGGAGGDASGASKAPEAEDPTKEKAAKEAMGSNFEMQLTGGVHPYSGSASPSAAGKDEVPNVGSLMGAGSDPLSKSAATGLSPSQIFKDAQEGTEGTEQGSMAGVSGKSETSLFDITKAKITKMFQVGNVGIPKNVEVKN